jgi:transglutaminase-like putative cysteine protease
MRLAIRHTTSYEFDAPVSYALQRLRLTPKETQGQRIVEWSMTLEGVTRQLE